MDELRIINADASRSRDLTRRRASFALMWGMPVAIIIVAEALLHTGFSKFAVGSVFVAGTLWFGGGCYINGRRCGRVHCRIDGIGMPLLGLVGVFALFGLLPLTWYGYASAFWLLLLASFVPEWFGRMYA